MAVRNVIIYILLASLFYQCKNKEDIHEPEYSFLVAGHTYGNPVEETSGIYPNFKNQFSYINTIPSIEFAIFTGDITRYGSQTQWEAIDEDLLELGFPCYFAVGNHDMKNRQVYEERYGQTYYNFYHENDLFIILDPNIDSWNINNQQLDLVKSLLNEINAKYNKIFVLFHQVLWWEANNEFKDIKFNSSEGRADTINFWTEVIPVFQNTNKPVYMFAGDVGAGSWSSDYSYHEYNNITFVSSGMGEGTNDNFLIINVYPNITELDVNFFNSEEIFSIKRLD